MNLILRWGRVILLNSSLSSVLPSTIIGSPWLPFRRESGEDMFSPPRCTSLLWQAKHLDSKIGCTRSLYTETESGLPNWGRLSVPIGFWFRGGESFRTIRVVWPIPEILSADVPKPDENVL